MNQKTIKGALYLLDKVVPNPSNKTTAVIVAGGSSTRFGEDKLFVEINGNPLLSYTLLAYENCPYIAEIVVVTKPESADKILSLMKEYRITKIEKIVFGGETRQKSVENGVMAVSPDTKYIAIADGARPCVTPENIAKVSIRAYSSHSATAGHLCADTVRRADKKGYVCEIVERENLWQIQTPQVFSLPLYLTALSKAKETATDDETLVFNFGHPVALVECGATNIKVTTKEDLKLASALLKGENNEF